MLQCEAAMGAAASLRLPLLYRMLRAGELLALLVFVSWSSSHVPSAVAAALRLAGSLLLNARFVFVLGNAIVLLLFALSRHDGHLSSNNDQQQQQPASSSSSSSSTTAADTSAARSASPAPQQQQQPVASAAISFPAASFTTPTTTTLLPPAACCSREVPTAPEEPDPVMVIFPRATLAFEDKKQPQHAAVAVRAVHKARAPRRSRSEKMVRRAASPELRRCESENGRRRRSSVTARDAEACWGREDADEFRRQVEAFIARQTRFHREESMSLAGHCEAAPAFTGALAVVE